MSDVKKEGDWFRDSKGTLFQTPDGKPPGNSGITVNVGNGNGGQSQGTWSNGQATKNK